MKLFSSRNRPVHMSAYPLERLHRERRLLPYRGAAQPSDPAASATSPLTRIVREYVETFARLRDGKVNSHRATIPEPEVFTNELKSGCYFLDATMVGVCEVDVSDSDAVAALVVLVEEGRQPESGNPAARWTAGAARVCASLRAGEIACVLAGYVRELGWAARAHLDGATDFDLATLASNAGLVHGKPPVIVAPFVGAEFGLAAVTTTMRLTPDRPLARNPGSGGLAARLGIGGTITPHERNRLRNRATHLGRFPMEKVRRVPSPTTLILEDEVPRVPKRAAFFTRALHGDLGDRAQRERLRFALKHPFAFAMAPLFGAMIPMQDGPAGAREEPDDDPVDSARAVKSLSYLLGADMVGICEAKPYVWYSHHDDGRPIEPYHKNAIVILIDQGHETMEGASGDDWISGSQSMRAYLRGAEIAGILAAQIRALGYSARSHTNRDSDVLHIPLVLLAGLGELSRIGELVLNPFVGPRFKSVVVTTDMPLAADRPIDFGLQDMCSKCLKCARECPCNAISYGDKVVFNGYEMWKPDVERCTRYRVTNPKGSACGRCMKMCPYTNEGLLTHRLVLWAAIHLPFARRWIARLDDVVQNGSLNPVKKWWSDLERVDCGAVLQAKGAHRRGLHLGRDHKRKDAQEIAYYPASSMPPPDRAEPFSLDRKAALEVATELETVAQALERHELGGEPPRHSEPRSPESQT